VAKIEKKTLHNHILADHEGNEKDVKGYNINPQIAD
jgi:hypothetical protein